MQRLYGDIWEAKSQDWICITTNQVVKSNGELVMGKGIALEAAQRYPDIAKIWAKERPLDKVFGWKDGTKPGLIRFPTKIHWRDPSPLFLVTHSIQQLCIFLNDLGREPGGKILLPPVGCGNGGLKLTDVEPILDKYLGQYPNVYLVLKQ